MLALLAVGAVTLAVVAARRWGRGGASGPWVLLSAWLLLPHLGLIVLSWLAFPVYVVRYAIVSLPALMLAVAAALRRIPSRPVGRVLLLLLCTASLTWAVVAKRQAHKPQWRQAFAWVSERCAPGDAVVVSGYESRYYLERRPLPPGVTVVWQVEPEGRLGGELPGSARVWYLQQARWAVPAALARRATARARRDFVQVSVVHFELQAAGALARAP